MIAHDFSDLAMQLEAHRAEFPRDRADRLPTEFVWRDPSSIPPRPWVYVLTSTLGAAVS